MTTPSHILLNQLILNRNSDMIRRYWLWVFLGSIIPDLPIYILFVYGVVVRIPQGTIWDEMYYQDFWYGPTSFFHSFVVAGILIMVAWFWMKKWLLYLSLSMFLHALLDFPLHADDGHRHFYPLSEWIFQSPISYWDPQYFGGIVGFMEAIIFLIALAFFLRRFARTWKWWVICILGFLWGVLSIIGYGFLFLL